jgi:hypothetical protein
MLSMKLKSLCYIIKSVEMLQDTVRSAAAHSSVNSQTLVHKQVLTWRF